MAATHGKRANVFKWYGLASDLTDEPCTASGNQAQITDPDRRLLNPNVPITFTDSGGANLLSIRHVSGIAVFDAPVTVVTATGVNAYVPSGNLVKVGYLYDWQLTVDLDVAEKTVFQDDWKDFEPGIGGATGSAEGFFAGAGWFDDLKTGIEGTPWQFLLQLFSYDPANDGSGDHFTAWVAFNSLAATAPIGEMVKEKISFQVCGMPAFTPNI
ncbi:hypothetical protein DSCO28_50410 [Desulfosarcina ovata subsp. sediminis]|uniref:Uncharacterized protein n=1 Tax=Desulfosarcina ovata subsp. sediminis TaxID=885957 RepID=A0A5K7ZW40_9BACT|nr:hypothetical protein [Desulfosarcina ovata]BBO80169.1 hypothetical protein DSCO28_07350 [Desulfosarcina ovata subsp. sediminis]BBO84475.1 hypothetical protein DSCO28_50410 [Desulfosarcina ovata subsp. sediminis]